MALDVLDAGPPPWSARRRRRASAAAVLAAAVVLGGVGADRWQRDREVDTLLRRTAVAEEVVRASLQLREVLTEQQSVLANVTDAPAPPPPAALREVARDAGVWLPRLRPPARAVASVRVLPWHRDVRTARRAQSRRLRTWTEELRRTQAQPGRVLRDAVEVRAAQEAAFAALREVAPLARVRAAYRP